MSFTAAIGRASVRFALSLISGLLFALGAVALLLSRLPTSMDPRTSPWLEPVREFVLIEGVVFFCAGGGGLLLARWPLFFEKDDPGGRWSPLPLLGFAGVVLIAVGIAWPLIAFWRDTLALLDRWGVLRLAVRRDEQAQSVLRDRHATIHESRTG